MSSRLGKPTANEIHLESSDANASGDAVVRACKTDKNAALCAAVASTTRRSDTPSEWLISSVSAQRQNVLVLCDGMKSAMKNSSVLFIVEKNCDSGVFWMTQVGILKNALARLMYSFGSALEIDSCSTLSQSLWLSTVRCETPSSSLVRVNRGP